MNCATVATIQVGLPQTLGRDDAPDPMDRPFPQWTVARAHQIMHHDLNDRAAAAELAQCPLLSDNWREKLRQRDRPA